MSQATEHLDQQCINTIRMLAADAVQKAKSGHPGMPMGAAAMAYVLWTRFLKHNPANPTWPNRDRFVLSAGHGSMLLYALLHLTGYDLALEDLQQFRQWGSRTPGHPEYGHTAGVETTTGPLGQGFATGVGMAIAERWLAAQFNRPGQTLVDHYTYAIVSDGDLMEGVASEAASLAGHLKLSNLCWIYDDNKITIEGSTSLGEGILNHTLPPGSQEVIPYALDASVDVTPREKSPQLISCGRFNSPKRKRQPPVNRCRPRCTYQSPSSRMFCGFHGTYSRA